MHKINIKVTNRNKATLTTLFITFFGFSTILFPLILINIIPESGVGHYIFDHVNYTFISALSICLNQHALESVSSFLLDFYFHHLIYQKYQIQKFVLLFAF